MSAPPVGYVVRVAGRAVYFAGDTDLFDGMRELGPLDVALLPIWGWGQTLGERHLNPESAAIATKWLDPTTVVPIHWGTYSPLASRPWATRLDRPAAQRIPRCPGRPRARRPSLRAATGRLAAGRHRRRLTRATVRSDRTVSRAGRATVYTLESRVASTIFVIVVLLRFFVPLAIPRFPLPAILACLVLDAADQSIFQAFTDDPLPGYQTYDKALDVYYLAIAYFSSMRNWREPTAFQVGRFLYLYRLVGVTLFELLDQRWLLFVFPNTFEYFFIAYEAVRTRWNPARLSALAVVSMAVFITVFIKFPQEWWIHIAQLDFTEFMADHPYLWFVLAGLVVAAGVVYWRFRSRLPVTDWAFTVDVDRHLPELPAEPTVPERFWSAVLVEKVVLLALISVIFAQVLPDVRASNLGVAIGVALLVVLNATRHAVPAAQRTVVVEQQPRSSSRCW